jgi:hypothetical protein
MTHVDSVNVNFMNQQREIVKIIASAWRSLLPKQCGNPNDPRMIAIINEDGCDPYISLMDGLVDIIPAQVERKTIAGVRHVPGFAIITHTCDSGNYMDPPEYDIEMLYSHQSVLVIGREAIRFLHQVMSDGYWQAQDEAQMAGELFDEEF